MILIEPVIRAARRIVVLVIGTTVVLIGIIMIVAPGPAVVVIPAGLAILATEFMWARRLLNRIKSKAGEVVERVRGLPAGSNSPPAEAEKDSKGAG